MTETSIASRVSRVFGGSRVFERCCCCPAARGQSGSGIYPPGAGSVPVSLRDYRASG